MIGRGVSMIKRWRNELITWLYVKYVFVPMLNESIEEPYWISEAEMAMVEKDYNTLQ